MASIKFASQIEDFGTVVPGDQLEASFSFANCGNEPLKILDIATSCGCAIGKASATELSPGEHGEITIAFHVPDASGVAHTAVVTTNAKNSPHVLQIRATPHWPLDVQPRGLHFSLLTSGQSEKRLLELFAADDESFTLDNIETSAPFLECREISKNGRRSLLEVVVMPEQVGTFEENISLNTGNPKRPSVNIKVTGVVVERSRIQPSRLLLGTQAPGSTVSASLKLRSFDANTENLLVKVENDDWRVSHKLISNANNDMRTSVLTIDLVVPLTEGFHSTNVLIRGASDRISVTASAYVHRDRTSIDPLQQRTVADSYDAVSKGEFSP